MKRFALMGLLALLLPLASACNSDDGRQSPVRDETATTEAAAEVATGPRRFLMGFSDVPAESSPAGIAEAYRRAGEHGELVLVQRAPAWSSFLAGAEVEQSLADTTRSELALAELYDLQFYLAVDPTNPVDRAEMALLPPELEGRDFSDESVREAYVGYIRYLAENYQPAYLALALEVNILFDQDPANYEAFLTVYAEAYVAAREASPASSIFVTFQYEELLGLPPLGGEHGPHWDLVDDFAPLDLLALSTYPGFSFDGFEAIPARYYEQVREHSNLALAIAEMGYSSGDNEEPAGAEAAQRLFVESVLASAETLNMAFVVWLVSVDPSYDLPRPFDQLATVGLIAADGVEKPAWKTWATTAARTNQTMPADETSTEDIDDGDDPAPTPSPGTSGSTPTP